jgi:hypothetical protein
MVAVSPAFPIFGEKSMIVAAVWEALVIESRFPTSS